MVNMKPSRFTDANIIGVTIIDKRYVPIGLIAIKLNRAVCFVQLHVLTLLVPCCDVRYDLHVRLHSQLFCRGFKFCVPMLLCLAATKPLSKLLTYFYQRSRGVMNQMWILKNSKDLLEYIQPRSLFSCNSYKTFDFSIPTQLFPTQN